jgi:hypothetical protein
LGGGKNYFPAKIVLPLAALFFLIFLAFSFSANAQTTYNISTVGTAKITSITSTDGIIKYGDGTGGTSLANDSSSLSGFMNLSRTITDVSELNTGDKIIIPITINATPTPHYAVSLYSPATTLTNGGETVFDVSYSASPLIVEHDIIHLLITNYYQ